MRGEGAGPTIRVDRKKWYEFTHRDDKAMSASVARYYLGPGAPLNYEKIAHELFADALAVGAIVLPSAYEEGDFEFVIITGQFRQKERLSVRFKARPGGACTNRFRPNIFFDKTRMVDGRLNQAVAQIYRALRELLYSH